MHRLTMGPLCREQLRRQRWPVVDHRVFGGVLEVVVKAVFPRQTDRACLAVPLPLIPHVARFEAVDMEAGGGGSRLRQNQRSRMHTKGGLSIEGVTPHVARERLD